MPAGKPTAEEVGPDCYKHRLDENRQRMFPSMLRWHFHTFVACHIYILHRLSCGVECVQVFATPGLFCHGHCFGIDYIECQINCRPSA